MAGSRSIESQKRPLLSLHAGRQGETVKRPVLKPDTNDMNDMLEKALRSSLYAPISSKLRRRSLLVITNTVNNLLMPLLNPVVSFLVVRLASVELWGEFVQVLIIVQLGMHIIAWGNKEYLLREFSLNPTRISRAWQTSLMTRLSLFVAFCVLIGLMGFPPQRRLLVLAWSLGLVIVQSFDALILYKKAFVFSTLVELGGLGFLALAIAQVGARIDLDSLIALWGAAVLIKTGALLARFRRYTLMSVDGGPSLASRIDLRYFGLAFPFFLLGFSGLLQSRIDLYSVNFFLSKSEVGQYQVLMTFMIYLQSTSNFVLAPFVKNIYRLSYRSILAISTRLFAFGAVLLAPALAVVHLVLHAHYHFNLPLVFVIVGGLLALPAYFYLPIVYALYKAGSQSRVVTINALGIGVNLLLSLLLLPRVGMIGAVTGAAVAQWCMFVAYLIQSRSIQESHALALPELPRTH